MAFLPCPDCGVKLPYLGKPHACRSGSGFGRSLAEGATSDLARVGKGESQRAEQRPSKATAARKDVLKTVGATVSVRSGTLAKAIAAGLHTESTPKRSRGRPKIEGKRPWESEGISRRTWYRRNQKGK